MSKTFEEWWADDYRGCHCGQCRSGAYAGWLAASEAFSASLSPQPTGPTVRVRVAVAVGVTGEYYAKGRDNTNDADMIACVTNAVRYNDQRHYWLEADLELPEPVVVTPSVTVEEQPR